MSINLEENKSAVRVSKTKDQAFLLLFPPDEGMEYRASDLEEILEKNGVTTGINRKTLQLMIDEKRYMEEELVAETRLPVDGISGKFEFLFNTETNHKPKILPDGSVDYSSIGEVETVKEGDTVVKYTPATKGQDGMDVYGNYLSARPGKELPQIKGKGFRVSEDKRTYTAALTGKITYQEERLVITNLLEINGDVTHVTGNVDFKGDIVVRGNVLMGMTIRAEGNITVNGHVEGAVLYAGKDVTLKNGMQGGGKGEIHCQGDISGKFFEQTKMRCGGDVRANAILNCNVITEGAVKVSGRLGVIVGGRTQAIRGISATTIGNMSEVKMELVCGVNSEVYAKIVSLERQINSFQEEKQKLETGLEQIDKILEKQSTQDLQEKKRMLLRAKISRESEIITLNEEKQKYERWMEDAQNVRLVVEKSIYRGSKITINGVQKIIESENYNVTYCRKGGEIESYANV